MAVGFVLFILKMWRCRILESGVIHLRLIVTDSNYVMVLGLWIINEK